MDRVGRGIVQPDAVDHHAAHVPGAGDHRLAGLPGEQGSREQFVPVGAGGERTGAGLHGRADDPGADGHEGKGSDRSACGQDGPERVDRQHGRGLCHPPVFFVGGDDPDGRPGGSVVA